MGKPTKIILCLCLAFVSVTAFLFPVLVTKDYAFSLFVFVSTFVVFTVAWLPFAKYKKATTLYFFIGAVLTVLALIKLLASWFSGTSGEADYTSSSVLLSFPSSVLAWRASFLVKKLGETFYRRFIIRKKSGRIVMTAFLVVVVVVLLLNLLYRLAG